MNNQLPIVEERVGEEGKKKKAEKNIQAQTPFFF